MSHQRRTILHVSLIEGVGPATVMRLVEQASELEHVYELSAQECAMRYRLSSDVARALVAGLADRTLLDRELDLIEKHAIAWVTIADAAYPALLKHIHAPPPVLYYRGAPPGSFDKLLAMVGARKAQHYAHLVLQELVPPLVHAGWSIISGGAIGADTMAHQHTLQAGGRTLAVVGSGLRDPYPASNTKLFDAMIAQGGSLISPFPVAWQALPHNFPARNRIIAGMARGCVVVQAAIKSGARITADFALEQGRQVFAVPGSLSDTLSAGCHALIKDGATIVLSAQDMLAELGDITLCHDKKQEVPASQQVMQEPSAHDTPGQRVLAHCRVQPVSFDDIMSACDVGYAALQEVLCDLQLAGLITQNGAGLWCVC